MAPVKVTAMILNVDLKCSCCYKKVKKLLCEFPQIRDQEFDVDKNKVRITVVCCDPEKIRDKLCCKGRKTIKSIEIIDQIKKQQTPRPCKTSSPPRSPSPTPLLTSGSLPPPKTSSPPRSPSPTPPPPASQGPQPQPQPRPLVCCQECYEGRGGGPCHHGNRRHGPPPQRLVCCQECSEGRGGGPCHHGNRRHGQPPQPSLCCQECYEGRGGGPCHHGNRRHGPPPPPSVCCKDCSEDRSGGPCHYGNERQEPSPYVCRQEWYEGRGGGPCHYGYGRPVPSPPRPCHDGYGYAGNRSSHVIRCDYFSEENPQGCSLM